MNTKWLRLEKVIKKIDQLATGDFHKQAVRRVGELIYDLALEGMQVQENPRGRPWALIKATQSPAERLSAVAAAGLSKVIEQVSARLSVRFLHAKAHQKGASRGGTDTRSGAKWTGAMLGKLSKDTYESLKPNLAREAWQLPARSFLPSSRGTGTRLPPPWKKTINAEMRKLFGKIWSSS